MRSLGSTRLVLACLAVAVALVLSSCSDGASSARSGDPLVPDVRATAAELAEEWFQVLHDADREELDAFLSPAFVLQRANGAHVLKAEYLDNPAVVDEWQITGVEGGVDGQVLVARYDVVTRETIDGEVFSTEPAPRISTFVWSDDRWHLVGHANFNAPEG